MSVLVDVLEYETPDGSVSYRACEAGRGAAVVGAHRREVRKRTVLRVGLVAVVGGLSVGYGLAVAQQFLTSLVALAVFVALGGLAVRRQSGAIPVVVEESARLTEAERRYDLDVIPS